MNEDKKLYNLRVKYYALVIASGISIIIVVASALLAVIIQPDYVWKYWTIAGMNSALAILTAVLAKVKQRKYNAMCEGIEK